LDTREVARNYRLSQWTQIVRECRGSGQTISTWCEDHNIDPKKYYYWLKKVREAACEALPALSSGNGSIIPVDVPAQKVDSVAADSPSADIVLHLGSVTMELHNNATAILIENTLRALQNVR